MQRHYTDENRKDVICPKCGKIIDGEKFFFQCPNVKSNGKNSCFMTPNQHGLFTREDVQNAMKDKQLPLYLSY